MGEIYADFVDLVRRPAVAEMAIDLLLCTVPIWVAVIIGLVIGWSWRPRWTGLLFLGLRSKLRFAWTAPPGFGARRLWFAFTALSAFSVCRKLWASFKGKGEAEPQKGGAEESSASPSPPPPPPPLLPLGDASDGDSRCNFGGYMLILVDSFGEKMVML